MYYNNKKNKKQKKKKKKRRIPLYGDLALLAQHLCGKDTYLLLIIHQKIISQ